MTKSWQAFLLSLLAVFALVACGSGEGRRKTARVCQTVADCVVQDAGSLTSCLVPVCADNVCGEAPAEDGIDCNDGDPSTSKDACSSGTCKGIPADCLTQAGACESASVDPDTGNCIVRSKADGETCDDGDLCTEADSCTDGKCTGGKPRECAPSDACHLEGACDPATGDCSNPAAPDGTKCDDALTCTGDDVCTGGDCAGVPVTCDDGRSCSTDTCDEALGGCQSDLSACGCKKSADCDDGNGCNGAETCNTTTSLCESGTALDCSALTDTCNSGSCDPKTGACVAAPVEDGLSCNDGDQCTRSDTCQKGKCTGADPITCGASGQCRGAGICDPATGQCTTGDKPDGSTCDDTDPCTKADACRGGVCSGELVICTTSDQCHAAGTCNAATGVCSNPAQADGTTCDDKNACTPNDVCTKGVCTPGPAHLCAPSDACHAAGTCDPKTGACSNPPVGDGASCNDGLLCTSTDQCKSGVCKGSAVTCNDNRSCTTDVCSETAGGCSFDPSKCACDANADCDDKNACTGTETCNVATGQCVKGTPKGCGSLDDACNVGSCDPTTGQCVKVPRANGTTCNDGSSCTQKDSCVAGVCTGTNPVVCAAADACHNPGVCDAATGQCTNPAKPDGSSCSDGNLCTRTDTCQSGSCVGQSPVACNAQDQCHSAGVCNPTTGACSNPTKANGTVCNDGNLCTQADSCQAGSCTGANPVACNAQDQCHGAGTCNPASGLCSNPARPNGTTCNDGNLCTQSDSCQTGTCTGTNPVACGTPDQCHTAGTCNPTSGLCSNPAKPNGATCNDGNSCTKTDSCQAGACSGGSPVTCAPLDQCHVAGTCDASTGACSNPAKANNTACDDGNGCTRSDTCQAGSCTGTSPVVCPAPDQCHDAGTCDKSTGQCSTPAKANGAACDDGNKCTRSDSCQAGACRGASPVVCSAADQCHDAGTCDAASGTCSNPAKANGATCNDGNLCTQSDSCQGGSCTGASPVTCSAPDQCHTAGACNPASGTCTNPPKPDGATCNDGTLCTRADSCQAGACVGANPVVCPTPDQCHGAGACVAATGTCTNPPKADGTLCGDGLTCTSGDKCTGGVCGGTAITCNDSIPCTLDSCSEASGGCVFDKKNCVCTTNADCDDKNACNGAETCNLATNTCKPGTNVDCSALTNACNTGTCNTTTGACSAVPKGNGTACDDGNKCTQTDSCQAGACTGTNPVTCGTPDQCHTAGSCVPATGACTNPPKADGATCSDGNGCTQTDTCQSGSCTGANPVTCAAPDQCHTAGSCVPATGACTNPPKADGATCSDGNGCTQTDTCQAGSCTGANPKTCPVPDQCHGAGACVPATGACTNPPKGNGTACDDSNKCTQVDTCQAGSCTGSSAISCTAQDQCHGIGTCAPATGVCSQPALADGTGCTDNDKCTQTDSCQAGVCRGGNPVTCGAPAACHLAGTCSSATGVCSTPSAPDGTTCNDANQCTRTDACVSGTCTGSNPTPCPALDACHLAGTCAPATGACSNPLAPPGTACTDSNLCTQTDACQSGVCVGTNPVPCAPLNQCYSTGTCNPADGRCSTPQRPDGSTCNDNNGCTQVDTCTNGACTGGNLVNCTALSQCFDIGTCNPVDGACSNPPKQAGTACDDGNVCTLNDACNGNGSCSVSTPRGCIQTRNPCTQTNCVNPTGCVTTPKPDGTTCTDNDTCTQTDQCANGICSGSNQPDDKPGDWGDAPGAEGAGPFSVDVMTFQDGSLATVGVFTNTIGFPQGAKIDPYPNTLQSLYLATYKEDGANGVGVSSTPMVAIAGVGVAGVGGSFTVGATAMSKDDTFTVFGTFTGAAHFGIPGSSFDATAPTAANHAFLYVAHFARNGALKWLATSESKGTGAVSPDSVAAFDDGSVVVVASVPPALTDIAIKDFRGNSTDIAVPGVFAARFLADGSTAYAARVAAPDAVLRAAAVAARSVAAHPDGSATIVGAFAGRIFAGIQGDQTITTAGSNDVWILRIEPNAARRWGGRMGGLGSDRAADVTSDGDDALVAFEARGTSPTVATPTAKNLYTLGGGVPEANLIRIDKAGQPLNATLAVDANAKGATNTWDLGVGKDGSVTSTGVFNAPTTFYGSLGFAPAAGTAPIGGGVVVNLPPGAVGPVIFASRWEKDFTNRFAVSVGGVASGILTTGSWDIVLAVHPSLSATIAGMFTNPNVSFGVSPNVFSLSPANKAGSPFIVHFNSDRGVDLCQ